MPRKPLSSLSLLALAKVEPYQVRKDEPYMSSSQLAHFKNILQVWKEALKDEVARTKNNMQDSVSNFADPVDRASQEEEFNLVLTKRDRENRLIRKIEHTLMLIEKNEFGYCKSCGEEIGLRRLEARPTAELCIDCKTLAEIKEKQLAG